MKTALITGATGALGSVVADVFEQAGWHVICLKRGEAVPQTQIDALLNIAGGFEMGPAVHETDEALFDRLMEMNAKTVLRMARGVVPGMIAQGHGKIINVAAMPGLKGTAGMGAYAASKSAVIRLTESMSAELRSKGINVNCVLPSVIDSAANRAAMPKADPAKWVTPEALADVMLFLASDAARAVHGAAIPVVGLS